MELEPWKVAYKGLAASPVSKACYINHIQKAAASYSLGGKFKMYQVLLLTPGQPLMWVSERLRDGSQVVPTPASMTFLLTLLKSP